MSYSLSANPEIDIPANEQPAKAKEHRYAVGYVVLFYRPDCLSFVAYGVSIETAAIEYMAIDTVSKVLSRKWKECDGYLVRVKAEQIPD